MASVNEITYTGNLLRRLVEHFSVKSLAATVYSFAAFALDPDRCQAYYAIAILIIFDFATGVVAAKVSGKEIKSAKVFRSALKFVVYFMLMSGAHMIQYTMAFMGDFVETSVIAFLAVTEVISLMENTGKMGFAVPQKLLNKLEDYRDN